MIVTVLGTGLMGYGMAARLCADGFDVRAWNRSLDKARPLAVDGVEVVQDAADAVDGAEVVITMLSDTDAVADVMSRARPRLDLDAVWLQMSTVGPDGMDRLADFAEANAVKVLDAPVLGTKKPAADGTLVVLASGAAELREKARPVLDSVGSRTVWAGDDLGQASQLKLVCNAWVLSVTAATGQSVALARGLGLDPNLFLDAISGTATDCPYAHVKGAQMISGDYETSFSIGGGLKDLGLITQAVHRVGISDLLVDAVTELNATAVGAGHARDDLAAVYSGFAAGSA